MLADMQRARALAWELPSTGWDVEVLTPASSEIRQDAIEPDASVFFAPLVQVHEVGSYGRWIFELFGSRSTGWRTFWPIYRRGRALLATGRFDLVYFSTTMFSYCVLGSCWKGEFGVPYVLDFHDPWAREPFAASQKHNAKARLSEWMAVSMERQAVIDAAGLVAVSPRYIETLERRYRDAHPAWLEPARHAVIPFGILERDLVEAGKTAKPSQTNRSSELSIHYVGVGGAIMARSFSLICRTLALLRSEGNPLVDRLRIRLYGTTYNWKLGDIKQLEVVAQDAGVGDLVREHPGRVSYRRSLELLLESDGALILGVDDAGYMPSKLFGYALSAKPLLASLHRDSPAFAQFRNNSSLGQVIWIGGDGEMPTAEAAKTVVTFLRDTASRQIFDRSTVLEPYLAAAMARRHAELFNACVGPENS